MRYCCTSSRQPKAWRNWSKEIQLTHRARFSTEKKNQSREEVRHTRLRESPYAAQRAVGNHQRSDRPILKITPRIDQRINCVPKFRGELDPTRREIIADLTRLVLLSSNKKGTKSAFEINEGPSRGKKCGTSREPQEHGEAKDALKSTKKKGYRTILERCNDDDTYRERMIGQALDEDDFRRRDEEAKFDRLRYMNATEKLWENTFLPKRSCDGARGIRKNSEHFDFQKQ